MQQNVALGAGGRSMPAGGGSVGEVCGGMITVGGRGAGGGMGGTMMGGGCCDSLGVYDVCARGSAPAIARTMAMNAAHRIRALMTSTWTASIAGAHH